MSVLGMMLERSVTAVYTVFRRLVITTSMPTESVLQLLLCTSSTISGYRCVRPDQSRIILRKSIISVSLMTTDHKTSFLNVVYWTLLSAVHPASYPVGTGVLYRR